jgi:membrane-bound lytic murein transglycosylase D
VKNICLAVFLLGCSLARAQEDAITLDDVMQSAGQWARENLDEEALRALQNADQEKVRQFFDAIHKQFHGEYIIDLAQLRDGARLILPLLESREETMPYAVWLKTRMDYFETADELRLLIPPVQTKSNQPAPPLPVPQPQPTRDIWIKKISTRPWPPEARSYVTSLKPIFAKQKIPAELVWIAEVESSFDPRARSPAGAVGLFQLMPDTAKKYGLKTTWPFDDRLKPGESAEAAARHLEYLHGRFKDWRLALAAYNAGEGAVQKVLEQHKARTYDAIATHLPAETQMYVPKVEATLLRREGVKISSLTSISGQ